MSLSRLAKVWRRTWIGAAMITVVAAAAWIAHASASLWPICAVGGALLLLAVFELDRMGALADRGLLRALLPAALLAIVAHTPLDLASFADDELALLFTTVLAAMLGYAGHNALRSARMDAPWSAAAVVTAAAAAAWMIGRSAVELSELALPVVAALAICLAWSTSPRWSPSRQRRHVEIAVVVFFALWLVPPLPELVTVTRSYGLRGLLVLIVLSKIGDIAGYYVGSAIGRHKVAPRISPGKTVEGCAASLAAGVAAGLACVELGLLKEGALGVATGPAVGAAMNLAAQAGDLLESLVKRRAGVKDAGTWFGPAGGVLDVVDSLLLTVPTALYVWPLLLPVDHLG